jgi:AraC-like DNA-binding protein
MEQTALTQGTKELRQFPHLHMLGMNKSNDASRSLSAHYNDGIEICILLKGRFDWQLEKNRYLLYPNDCTVTLPWQEHGGANGIIDPGELMWLILTPEKFQPDGRLKLGDWSSIPKKDCSRVGKTLCNIEKPYFAADDYLKSLFFELFAEIKSFPATRKWRVNNLLDEILCYVTRELQDSPLERKNFFDLSRLEQRINADLQHKWTLADLEKLTGYGKSRMTTIIRENTGVSPIIFITLLRLDKAKELLKNTDTPVTRIAFECGFNSSQRFSTVFKKFTSMSPSYFRKNGDFK